LRNLLSRFVAVCNTVAFAHSRGVVHRDLKPANIMLGEYGETLVVDWGLAKQISASETEATALATGPSGRTPLGRARGPPEYMRREQAAGRGHQGAPAGDLCGLGATLYALLTGRPPFEGSPGAVLEQVQRGTFPRPRQRKASVPPALEAVCLKAMALQ